MKKVQIWLTFFITIITELLSSFRGALQEFFHFSVWRFGLINLVLIVFAYGNDNATCGNFGWLKLKEVRVCKLNLDDLITLFSDLFILVKIEKTKIPINELTDAWVVKFETKSCKDFFFNLLKLFFTDNLLLRWSKKSNHICKTWGCLVLQLSCYQQWYSGKSDESMSRYFPMVR